MRTARGITDERMALDAVDSEAQASMAIQHSWFDSQQSATGERARWACCTLLRRLTGGIADRPGVKAWLGVHDGDQTSHVIYRFEALADGAREHITELAGMAHTHLLEIETFDVDERGRLRVRTVYTGNQQQWIRLADVLKAKGGQMPPAEAERAIQHLLEACAHAHARGCAHGELTLDRVLVDRRGCVLIELYGFDRAVAGLFGTSSELRRDELRSVAAIAYTLLTGLEPAEPMIAAGHLVKRLPPAWDAWLERGLSAIDGFDSAREAIDALPSRQPEVSTPSVHVVRRVLRSIGSTPPR